MRATLLRLARVLAAEVEDISDAEEVAMERREFEEAVNEVANSRSADALLNFVKRWRWDEEIPTGVDSPHVDWESSDNLPPRSRDATAVGYEFTPRLNSVGSALATKLGIDAQSPLTKVLSATVRCVSVLGSSSANFDKEGVRKSLIVECREYAYPSNYNPRLRPVIPAYVPPWEEWGIVNGESVRWHPLRD